MKEGQTDMVIFGAKTLHGIPKKTKLCLIIGGLLAVILLQTSACSKAEEDSSSKFPPSESTSNSASSDLLSMSIQQNSYLIAINHPIEAAYLEDSRSTSGDTTALVLLYGKYADLWKQEAVKYQELISLEIAESDVLLDSFQAVVTADSERLESDLAFFAQLQSFQHGDGTIISVNNVKYAMQCYRIQAVKFIQIYDELMVGRGWSWRTQGAYGDGSSVSSNLPSPAVD